MKMSSFMSVDFYKPTLPRHTCTDKKQFEYELWDDFPWNAHGFTLTHNTLKCCSANVETLRLLKDKNIIKIVCAVLSSVKILSHKYQTIPIDKWGSIISLSNRLSVDSEWVCVCVWMFPNSSETANLISDLKFWEMIPLGIGKVLG